MVEKAIRKENNGMMVTEAVNKLDFIVLRQKDHYTGIEHKVVITPETLKLLNSMELREE